jgi:hypothetical protein
LKAFKDHFLGGSHEQTNKQTNKQTEQHLLVRPTDEGEHSQNKKEEEKEEEGE